MSELTDLTDLMPERKLCPFKANAAQAFFVYLRETKGWRWEDAVEAARHDFWMCNEEYCALWIPEAGENGMCALAAIAHCLQDKAETNRKGDTVLKGDER